CRRLSCATSRSDPGKICNHESVLLRAESSGDSTFLQEDRNRIAGTGLVGCRLWTGRYVARGTTLVQIRNRLRSLRRYAPGLHGPRGSKTGVARKASIRRRHLRFPDRSVRVSPRTAATPPA